ncbi:MAG: hypothetical protein AB7G80_06460 [Dongiaceae bacterium]
MERMFEIDVLNSELKAWQATISKSIVLLGGRPMEEKFFSLVKGAMAATTRTYHDLGHGGAMSSVTDWEREQLAARFGLKDFGVRMSNVIILAGFVHDIVYAHVDGGVTPEIREIISPYCEPVTPENEKQWKVKEQIPDDPIVEIVLGIFGIDRGKTLSIMPAEQNEFLSALVGARWLQKQGLDMKTIAAIVTAVEATKPFRTQAHFSDLENRLVATSQTLGLDLAQEEIDHAMYGATFLANKDVYGFAGNGEKKAGERLLEYLRGTWKLIPEFDASLRTSEVTPQQYRQALVNNLNFVKFLLSDHRHRTVFHFHNGGDGVQYPAENEIEGLHETVQETLKAAELYLKTKIASASLVEAIGVYCGAVTYHPGRANITLSDLVAGSANHLDRYRIPYFAVEPRVNGSNREQADERSLALTGESLNDEATHADIVIKALRSRGDNPAFGFDVARSPLGQFLFEALKQKDIGYMVELSQRTMGNDKVATTPEEKTEQAMRFLIAAKRLIGPRALSVVVQTVRDVQTRNAHSRRHQHLSSLSDRLVQEALQASGDPAAREKRSAAAFKRLERMRVGNLR